MQIEKYGSHAVLLTSESSAVYINLSLETPLKLDKVADSVLIVGKHEDSGNQYTIIEPGEYEVAGVSVIALENREEKQGEADFYELDIDGVIVTWQADPTIEINKDGWEILADTHLLLLDISSVDDDTKLDKFISKHNPRKLVIIGDQAKAEKLTGVPVKQSGKKLKFTSKDFSEIEYTTESVHLA